MSESREQAIKRLYIFCVDNLIEQISGADSKARGDEWPGETQREWGTPIVMDAAVKARVDAMWGELGL